MKEKSRRVYITFGRIQKLGATPGCRACLAFAPNHTPECIARHEEAFGSKTPGPEPDAPSDELENDVVDVDEDPITGVTSGLDVTASIACDAATILPQEHVQEIFQDVFNQRGQFSVHGATASPSGVGSQSKKPKLSKNRHNLSGSNVLFEFACDKSSNLGTVGLEHGVKVYRLCKEDIDLEDPESIDQLIQQVKALPGCSIHCSIKCKPWSQWQRLNQRKYPRLSASIRHERERSEELLKQFIRVGNTCLDNGGDCSFEWPRYCSGWALPCLQEWILERNLHSAAFDGCAVGVEADGKPARKPWRFVSSSSRLVENLAAQKCTHTAHEPLQGKWTRMSAFYPRKLCEIMIQSLFPHVANRHVWSMPCVARIQQPHRQKLVAGYPSVPLDVAMSNVGCKELVTPAYVHRLLDRSEWKDRPEVLDAINSEKQGLLANGTWDESKIRPKAEVLAEARAKGQKVHVGALMVIVSIKGFEKSPAEWSIKARIVFRGDAVRDEDNQAAVFDELTASAPTSLGGLNLVIAFGLLDGHTCSTSDCIKAYVQSFLDA